MCGPGPNSGGVFAAEVENHTFLCGREVMLTAVPPSSLPNTAQSMSTVWLMPKSMVVKFQYPHASTRVDWYMRRKWTSNRLDRLFIATHASASTWLTTMSAMMAVRPGLFISRAYARVFVPFASMGLSYGGLHWMIQWAQVVSPSCSARCSCSVLFLTPVTADESNSWHDHIVISEVLVSASMPVTMVRIGTEWLHWFFLKINS